MDRLEEMFKMRQAFMLALSKKFPSQSTDYPLDLSDKSNQQYARDIALRGVEEMFEALQHLKNWKPHRSTSVEDFNSEEFIEEIKEEESSIYHLFQELMEIKDKAIILPLKVDC